ncbi:uncharacterized protein PV07_09230 [Cladophialophora immunda]|uniref:Enoyl reductase (ER) domain-containing protein n=1 Tax=Cladophialophora immunda TaxID=569365 RepID=A0A0D2C4L3_9EURO|nr:uncharacterized protein PV07_09230 [Cladophialophora immunda]KIW26103.1 hypothetical protein PV07_09230 [Cladophialophora immunda]
MSRKTVAIVATGDGEAPSLQEVVLDDIRADEAIVEIQAVGVCHADLAVLHGHIPLPFPRVLGHEGAGTVREVGADIDHVRPGDKVILSFNPCRECANCKAKLPGYCDHQMSRTWAGLRPDQSFTLRSGASGEPTYGNFFGQSSFARLAIANKSCLVKVPPETDLKLFAPLGCGVQTGYGVAANTLNIQAGDSFVVSGCGAVGLSAIMAAKARGAETIIAVDLQERRLGLAQELGATHTVNGASRDLIGEIRAIAPLPAGVRYALDTTAVPKVIENMIEVVGVRGKIVIVGATPADKLVQIRPLAFLNAGKQLVGCVEGDSYPPESIPMLLQEARKGALPIEKMVQCYKAADFHRAFEDMASGKTIKPVLVWDDIEVST